MKELLSTSQTKKIPTPFSRAKGSGGRAIWRVQKKRRARKTHAVLQLKRYAHTRCGNVLVLKVYADMLSGHMPVVCALPCPEEPLSHHINSGRVACAYYDPLKCAVFFLEDTPENGHFDLTRACKRRRSRS